MGLLVGNLGTIYMIISNLTSSIVGPLAGIFLTGILIPWVNSKVSGKVMMQ